MSAKLSAVMDLKIILGKHAALSQQRGETLAQWRETLVSMRDALTGNIADLDVQLSEKGRAQ